MSELAATAGSLHLCALKYRASLALPLATVVAIAKSADSNTALGFVHLFEAASKGAHFIN